VKSAHFNQFFICLSTNVHEEKLPLLTLALLPPEIASLVSFASQLETLGPGSTGSREETLLRVEKENAAGIDGQHTPCYPQDRQLVILRSNATYPLLVDPRQRAAAEYFAVLRSRLLNARNKTGIHSVVITSPQKQDGKSFTSLNLAISLAQLQQLRILLVDGDLRLRGATRVLGIEQNVGLADFLHDLVPFEDCIRATNLSHLFVASAGNFADESLPAILEGVRWPEFIQKAKQEFDLVIVDSVPVSAPIADFELLLNACDAALLVVHVRKTTRASMSSAVNRMQGKLLGVVVNNKEHRLELDYHSPYGGKKA
jgi:capsular exopolysaccharide synthesis family protein